MFRDYTVCLPSRQNSLGCICSDGPVLRRNASHCCHRATPNHLIFPLLRSGTRHQTPENST